MSIFKKDMTVTLKAPSDHPEDQVVYLDEHKVVLWSPRVILHAEGDVTLRVRPDPGEYPDFITVYVCRGEEQVNVADVATKEEAAVLARTLFSSWLLETALTESRSAGLTGSAVALFDVFEEIIDAANAVFKLHLEEG